MALTFHCLLPCLQRQAASQQAEVEDEEEMPAAAHCVEVEQEEMPAAAQWAEVEEEEEGEGEAEAREHL